MSAPGHIGVDYESRVDFERLRSYRLAGPGVRRAPPAEGGLHHAGRGDGGLQHEVSIVAEEAFTSMEDGPLVRITTPHVPLPAAAELEDAALPSVHRIVETIWKAMV